ncbi:leukocyte elastase inhibitor [Folsomia candida]|uniref:Leukocyte elastase inhibitor B n=1 Tax=Folsomia candida TaxID=158441 RepID=A0A226DLL2_FOLCA|nr:leukocyte elastase inhibitor [Folsomia candida]XP_035713416.1 leukocyte elastase inhibitor [Folsomia candida]OXA45547.1 Leukocyte elastase inhibitor B [Folsomia candida]
MSIYTLSLVLILLISSPSDCLRKEETSNLQRLSRAHLEFALSLFRTVAGETSAGDNVLLSPYSVASVLSQLWLGSAPESGTFTQLENVLHYKDGGLGPEKVHAVFHSGLDTGDDPDFQSVVKQGNALFLQDGIPIESSYRRDLRHFYNSSVEEVDFSREDATLRINRWVSKRTGGFIPTLIESPLPASTKLVLVNALALKAFWKNSFDPTRTAASGIFHRGPNAKLEIPMMAGKFKVLLGESDTLRCRLLELPFRGKRLSMFIMLPDEDVSSSKSSSSRLSHLEENLTAQNLKKLFASLREEMVHIRMPRFSMEDTSRLTDTLMTLGLRDIFDPSHANFSRISASEEEKISVSTLAHKVSLEITEKGAHAAAATATGIERFGEIGEFFEINRPFVFFIWDYVSGALLFIGRVADPKPLAVP